MTRKLSILLLEDSEVDAELICTQIDKADAAATVTRVKTRDEYQLALAADRPDLILSDFSLPGLDGMTALAMMRQFAPDTPFIFVSGILGEDIVTEALRYGATDYIVKQRLERLGPAVRRALDEVKLKSQQRESEAALEASQLRLRELADAMPQLIWATDAQGTVVYVNRPARRYQNELARNEQSCVDLNLSDDRQLFSLNWKRSRNLGQAAEFECRLRPSENEPFRWHRVQIVPMHNGTGAVEGWVTTAIDIEEHKQREESLRLSEEALKLSQQTLEQKVIERTEAFSKLSARLLTIQDEERRKFAQEIHDGFGQMLVALKLNIDTVINPFNALSDERKARILAESSQILEYCLSQARTLSHLLHPPMLDISGFALAAHWYAKDFSERTGIATEVVIPRDMARLQPEIEVVFFRVLQASLSNVHLHSHARRVDVLLAFAAGKARLSIRDNGIGISSDKLHRFRSGGFDGGAGLAGLRERVRDLGGALEVECESGTTVTVTLAAAAAAAQSSEGSRSLDPGEASPTSRQPPFSSAGSA